MSTSKPSTSMSGGGSTTATNSSRIHTNYRRTNDQLSSYVRNATILRKNFIEWDKVLHNPSGEDWMNMLGRCNASYHQIMNVNQTIDDMMEHFVYVPQRSTANPQDIPFFLSTRLETTTTTTTIPTRTTTTTIPINDNDKNVDIQQHLMDYENYTARLAQQYEERMVRF
jgi:hypothetical protein